MNPDSRAKQNASEYGLSIITGGSSGIGKSIIEQVSKLGPGCRICNISRRKPASFSIGPSHVHLETDLAEKDERAITLNAILKLIEELPENRKILLVNNAGYGFYGGIAERPAEDHLKLLEVNTLAIVEMTARLLPELKRRGGGIINIASTTSFQPTPWMATYGASKTFLLHWSLALREELRGEPVNCLAVCPGPTRTRFHESAGFENAAKTGNAGMSPDRVAKEALRALDKDRPLHIPGIGNRILAFIAARMPYLLVTRIAGLAIRRYRPPTN